MQLLKDRIRKDGKIKAGNVLKVDSFLNHQMDTDLFVEIGKEFKRRFADCEINKILTIEASGIGIACVVAQQFHVAGCICKENPDQEHCRRCLYQQGRILYPWTCL